MKTKVLLLTGLFLSSMFAGQLSAQRQMNNQNSEDCVWDVLTQDQKTSIEAIRLQSTNKVNLYRADLDIKRAELRKLRVADNPSETLIHKKIDEMSVLNTQIRKENASKTIAVRNELTPEQRSKYGANMGYRRNKNCSQMNSPRHQNCNYRGDGNFGGRGRNR